MFACFKSFVRRGVAQKRQPAASSFARSKAVREERGLLRFEKREAAQHVQKIERIARIFERPVIGLDEASVAKRACSLRSSSIWN